jgi:hypothetical protein
MLDNLTHLGKWKLNHNKKNLHLFFNSMKCKLTYCDMMYIYSTYGQSIVCQLFFSKAVLNFKGKGLESLLINMFPNDFL